jgi:hypothetical protein
VGYSFADDHDHLVMYCNASDTCFV